MYFLFFVERTKTSPGTAPGLVAAIFIVLVTT